MNLPYAEGGVGKDLTFVPSEEKGDDEVIRGGGHRNYLLSVA